MKALLVSTFFFIGLSFTSSAQIPTSAAADRMSSPHGVFVDAAGTLRVADRNNNRVIVKFRSVDPSGNRSKASRFRVLRR